MSSPFPRDLQAQPGPIAGLAQLDPAALDPALRVAAIVGELYGKRASDRRVPSADEWRGLCAVLGLDPASAEYARDVEPALERADEDQLYALEVMVRLRSVVVAVAS